MTRWFFRVRRCRGQSGYLAWCAKTPVLGDGPLDVDWKENVHFEFGETEDEALRCLKQKVAS